MGRWIADSLVVWDDRARRISVITPEGGFARSFSLTLPNGLPFARVIGFYPDGSFLGMSFTNMGQAPKAGLQRVPIGLHHFGSDGSHLSALGEAPGTEVFYTVDGSGQVGLYRPHFFRSGNHLASERLLLAADDQWELTFRSRDGKVEQIVRWLTPAVSVTKDALAVSWQRMLEETSEARQRATRALADELTVHETLPAFENVFYDGSGRVWLQAYDPFIEDFVEWTVVGRDGEFLAAVTLPRGLRLLDAGSDWVLARLDDKLGVERLLLMTIVPTQ